MKNIKNVVVTGLVIGCASSVAYGADIPDLSSSIEALDASQLSAFEADIGGVESVISADVDFAFDTAVVNEALEQGFITEAEAADLDSALEVIEANQEFFDFDIASLIGDLISGGNLTPAYAAETLAIFNGLSDADKAIVGQSSFSPWLSGTNCGGSCSISDLSNPNYQSAAYKSLSAAGQTAVASAPLSDPAKLQ